MVRACKDSTIKEIPGNGIRNGGISSPKEPLAERRMPGSGLRAECRARKHARVSGTNSLREHTMKIAGAIGEYDAGRRDAEARKKEGPGIVENVVERLLSAARWTIETIAIIGRSF